MYCKTLNDRPYFNLEADQKYLLTVQEIANFLVLFVCIVQDQ